MPSPIIILGMHRSGTSFLARALNLCGLWLGSEETLLTVEGRAFSGNPKGNYESRAAFNINQSILKDSSASWDAPKDTLSISELSRQRILDFISYHTNNIPDNFVTWGWKDPRTAITFDAWDTLISSETRLVVIYRDPILVAQSLMSRDGFTMEKGLNLWYYYNQIILKQTRKRPSLYLRFDTDPDELIKQLHVLAAKLGLHPNMNSVAGWFDNSLVRERKNKEIARLPERINELWEQLQNARQASESS